MLKIQFASNIIHLNKSREIEYAVTSSMFSKIHIMRITWQAHVALYKYPGQTTSVTRKIDFSIFE